MCKSTKIVGFQIFNLCQPLINRHFIKDNLGVPSENNVKTQKANVTQKSFSFTTNTMDNYHIGVGN